MSDFNYIILTLVAILSFLDWLIGETKRKSMREKFGEFWIVIDDNDLLDLMIIGIKKILIFLRVKLFNNSSRKRMLLFAFIYTVIISLLFSVFSNQNYFGPGTGIVAAQNPYVQIYFGVIIYMIVDIYTDYLSIQFSLKILDRLATVGNIKKYVILIFIDILFALIIVLITSNLGYFLYTYINGAIFYPFFSGESYFDYSLIECAYQHITFSSGMIWDIYFHYPWFDIYMYLTPITALWPTILSIFMSLLFFILKIFKPVLKPILQTILYAFFDSKRGILTTIAIFISGLMKLVELYF